MLTRSRLYINVLLLFLVTVCANCAERKIVHAIMVQVNGQKIIQDEVSEEATYLIKKMFPGRSVNTLSNDDLTELSTRALNELIKIKLIHDEAEELSISVSKKEIYDTLKYKKIDPLRATQLERDSCEADLLFEEILKQFGKRTRHYASPREVQQFYRKHKTSVFRQAVAIMVRHIYLSCGPSSRQEKTDLAKRIRSEIMAVEPKKRAEAFGEFAKEYSEDQFRNSGGKLLIGGNNEGWFIQDFKNKRKDGYPIFPEAMYRAIKGLNRKLYVTEPIESDRGIHLLFLENSKGGRQIPFAEAQKMISSYFDRMERVNNLRAWLKDKYERSNITWHDGTPYPLEQLLPPEMKPGDALKGR